MKSEKGLIHLLIAAEVAVLFLIVILGVVKQMQGPDESTDIVINTQNNVIEEPPDSEITEITEMTEVTESTESTETEEVAELFSEEIRTALADMTLEEKVAQLFLVSPETLTDTDRVTVAGNGTRTALGTYPVGGMLYAEANYLGRTQMEELLRGAQEMSFEQSGRYLFAATPVMSGEQPMYAVAWNGAEAVLAELIRVGGDTAEAPAEGLLLLSLIETEEQLMESLDREGLRCAAAGENRPDAVTMLQNGADMLCVTADFAVVYESVLDAAESGVLSGESIDRAVGRILTQKTALAEQVVEE